jgi:hypothetical protein
MDQLLWIAVLLNASATITLWQRAARRPEKLKKKFLNRLWKGKPITPKHEPPPPLKADTRGVTNELQFSSDFEDFAEVVNSWLADPHTYPHGKPWRLQEFPNSDLVALWGTSGAVYCRTYAVFHNQVRIGKIEITPDWEYSTQDPRVLVHVELHWVRLLDFGTIRGFLIDIAAYLSSKPRSKLEWLQTIQKIDLALLGVLWETQEISQFKFKMDEPSHGEIKVTLDGLGSFYFERREAWRKEFVARRQR